MRDGNDARNHVVGNLKIDHTIEILDHLFYSIYIRVREGASSLVH